MPPEIKGNPVLAGVNDWYDYGLSFEGIVTTATDTTHFKAEKLAGFGDEYFKDYYVYVVWDAGGAGAAPQGEKQPISAYTSSDGTFTHTAFTVQLAVGDKVLVVHKSISQLIDNLADTAKAKAQIAATTIDLNQAAATYDLLTGTTQAVILESLVFRLPNVDVSDDATITSISIQTDEVTPQVIISNVDGAKANLTAEAQIAWTGAIDIPAGTKIQLTIAGGAADAATVCNVVAKCRAVVAGGYLA